MKVKKILEKIFKEAALEKKQKKTESLFFQMVVVILLENLHQELSQKQRENLAQLVERPTPDFIQVDRLLNEAGLKSDKREELLDRAIRNALKEVLEVTGDRLSSNSKKELLQIIKGNAAAL